MASRFRGFLPVVIDVECGGFNPNTDALLEIAAVLIEIQGDGSLDARRELALSRAAVPRARSSKPASLAVNGIDPLPSAAAGDSGEGSADAPVQGQSAAR